MPLQCILRIICKAHAHAICLNRALCSLCCLLFPTLASQVLDILSTGYPVHPRYWSWKWWKISKAKKGIYTSKGIYKYVSSKRKIKENMVLLKESGTLMTKDSETGWGYWMLSSPQFLLVKATFRNLRTWRPGGKSGARNTYSWWKRIRLKNP